MNPEQNPSPVSEPYINDCFEITKPRPFMIQFVGKRMTWGFDWSRFTYFVLKANPECRDPKVEPADELILYFDAAEVTLLGWCLNLMLDDLASHSVTHVWKLGRELANQDTEVAWISEIFVLPYDDDVWAEHAPADPPNPIPPRETMNPPEARNREDQRE